MLIIYFWFKGAFDSLKQDTSRNKEPKAKVPSAPEATKEVTPEKVSEASKKSKEPPKKSKEPPKNSKEPPKSNTEASKKRKEPEPPKSNTEPSKKRKEPEPPKSNTEPPKSSTESSKKRKEPEPVPEPAKPKESEAPPRAKRSKKMLESLVENFFDQFDPDKEHKFIVPTQHEGKQRVVSLSCSLVDFKASF